MNTTTNWVSTAWGRDSAFAKDLAWLRVHRLLVQVMAMKQYLVRLPDGLVRRLDAWRRAQQDLPNRAEAIRRILEEALPKEKEKKK